MEGEQERVGGMLVEVGTGLRRPRPCSSGTRAPSLVQANGLCGPAEAQGRS